MLPRSFRGEDPANDPASALPEYRPPSMLSQHKGVAIFFVALFIALSVYLYTATHKPLTFDADPEPVYIQSVVPVVPVAPSEPAGH